MAAAEAADRWAVDHWGELSARDVVPLSDRIFELLRGIVTTADGVDGEQRTRT
jgi:hypothetical protein